MNEAEAEPFWRRNIGGVKLKIAGVMVRRLNMNYLR